MIPHLLRPFPDESFYSVICRYHLISKYSYPSPMMRKLFRTSFPSVLHPLPFKVNEFLTYLNLNGKQERLKFLQSTTLLPTLATGHSKTYIGRLHDAMERRTKDELRRTYGLGDYDALNYPYTKYCRECISDDLIEHGIAYWHRSHNIPSVLCCHKHNAQLYMQKFDTSGAEYRVTLQLPHQFQRGRESSRDVPLHRKTFRNYQSSLYRISQFFYRYIHAPTNNGPHALSSKFKVMLADHGLDSIYSKIKTERYLGGSNFGAEHRFPSVL